jgi:hypothetical protein
MVDAPPPEECTALVEQIEEVRFAIARGIAMSVWIVLTPEGELWGGQAFSDVQLACSSICSTLGVYWPQLETRGYRLMTARLQW